MNNVAWMFLIFLLNSLAAFAIGYALARHLWRGHYLDEQELRRNALERLVTSQEAEEKTFRKLRRLENLTWPRPVNKPTMTTEQAESLFKEPGSLVAAGGCAERPGAVVLPGGWNVPKDPSPSSAAGSSTPPIPGPACRPKPIPAPT